MTEVPVPSGPVAHSPNDAGRWHDLREHLENVSARARRCAGKMGVSEWAALAGIWHDLGKYHPDFQQMIRDAVRSGVKRRVDHSTLGALHAARLLGPAFEANPAMRQVEFLSLLLTATIAGHHAGLPESRDVLRMRLERQADRYREMLEQSIPPELLKPATSVPPLPPQMLGEVERPLVAEFLVRMVLSAMVDADRLDAEAFATEGRPEAEQPSIMRRYSSISDLRTALDEFIDAKVRALRVESMAPVERAVHEYRQAILAACRQAADAPPGAFALDVATGGGKTLASLSFALRHADAHRKDRVIIVIPYTSIIEQTAAEYRRALGSLAWNVLEHHSAVSDEPDEESTWGPPDLASLRRRLAAENWDPPVIVTTAVQFFESLYSARPSRCRKLHNIANSIVVLDEAQTLPPGLLNPTVWVINELVEHYGATVVLSTATQPALEPPFPEVRNARQIVPLSTQRPPARVRVEVLAEQSTTWSELSPQLVQHPQVLCITHLRRDARDLTEEVDRVIGDEASCLHLSAAMCAAHRAAVIAEVRHSLAARRSCRVVSTQLVEAGVDLDFPVVYRALAGIDSMVQAAGRANREGRLGVEGGLLRIYRPTTKPPLGLPRLAADAADGLIEAARVDARPLGLFDSGLARSYFRRFYQRIDDKDGGVSNLRREFRFRDVEAAYCFIGDAGFSVIVPYDGIARQALRAVWRDGVRTRLLRALQRYTVSLFRGQIEALLQVGAIQTLLPVEDAEDSRTFVLRDTHASFYHPRFGLLSQGVDAPESGAFIT